MRVVQRLCSCSTCQVHLHQVGLTANPLHPKTQVQGELKELGACVTAVQEIRSLELDSILLDSIWASPLISGLCIGPLSVIKTFLKLNLAWKPGVSVMFLAQSQCSPFSPEVDGLCLYTTLPIVRVMSFCYGLVWLGVFFLLFAKLTGFAAHMEVLIIIPKQLCEFFNMETSSTLLVKLVGFQ